MVRYVYDEAQNEGQDWVEIDIGRGYRTKVDRDVARLLDGTTLHASGTVPWVYANISRPGQKTQKVHRWLMNPPEGMVIDHKNDDCMDNRRSNLQICTISENTTKRRSTRNGPRQTPYRGVRLHNYTPGRFIAHYSPVPGKGCKYIASFDTAEEAALAYNVAALRTFKQFAKLNWLYITNPWPPKEEL